MEVIWLFFSFVIFQVTIPVNSAPPSSTGSIRCRECSGVTDPHYCSRVVDCGPDEECHTEEVLGEDSTLYYNAGCMKRTLCEILARGKRSDLHVCEGCCATDLCNTELCPHKSNNTIPGVQCYFCDEVDSPENCTNRITCAEGEQCIIQKYITDSMEIKYSLGCETSQRCGLLQSLGKRSTQICNECCDRPGCNRHMCGAGNSATSDCYDEPDMDCKLANDSHDICAKRSLAALQYCRKFCGYCSDGTGTTVAPPTGSTEDPCRDSGDLDCKQMNDSLHICDVKDSPPALLYCPRFCGLCIPQEPVETGCVDSADVDCQRANETQNACELRTFTATKYCKRFCGYCNADGSPVTTLSPPTGTTQDPCRDNLDTDCAGLNATLGICSNPNSPPTVMYCPRFCGLCTPVCADTPDIDCKHENETSNICGRGTLAAKNFCPRFCGYCSVGGATTVTPPPSTCADNPDTDCSAMDVLLKICTPPYSAPTELYCPKYCGLCT